MLLVPAVIAGSALLVWSEPAAMGATLPRIALLALFYLLYFVAFAAISLGVSARTRSSRTALIYLLGFWIVNCLIAPRAAVDLSKRLDPTPSNFTFTSGIDRDLHGDPEAVKKAEIFKAQVLKKFGVDSVEKLPVSFTGISLQKGEEDGAVVFDRHYNELWDRFERQNRNQQKSAVLAPLLAVRALSMALAGTDFEQHRHFATEAERYRRFFIKLINEDITKNAVSHPGGYTRGNDLWAQIPAFRYQAPELHQVLGTQGWSIAILALWCGAGILFAAFSLRAIRPECDAGPDLTA